MLNPFVGVDMVRILMREVEEMIVRLILEPAVGA